MPKEKKGSKVKGVDGGNSHQRSRKSEFEPSMKPRKVAG